MSGKSFTDSEVLTIRKLWLEGHSAGKIADQLGRSRNSIIGKVFRLRLPPHLIKVAKKYGHQQHPNWTWAERQHGLHPRLPREAQP